MKLVCGTCREAKPFLMSCIHTFAPPAKNGDRLGQYDRDEEMRTQREMDESARHSGI